MHISKKQFYIITFLFLLLPLSVQWKLLLFGTKTTGVVVRHAQTFQGNAGSANIFSIIQFQTSNGKIEFSGPEDLNYQIGKEVKILYNKNKPSQYVMLTFGGLFLSNKIIIPGIFLIIWFAFYLTIKQMRQQRN